MKNNAPFGFLMTLTGLLLFLGIGLTAHGVQADQGDGLFAPTGEPEQAIIGLSLIGLGIVGLIGILATAAVIVAAARTEPWPETPGA